MTHIPRSTFSHKVDLTNSRRLHVSSVIILDGYVNDFVQKLWLLNSFTAGYSSTADCYNVGSKYLYVIIFMSMPVNNVRAHCDDKQDSFMLG